MPNRVLLLKPMEPGSGNLMPFRMKTQDQWDAIDATKDMEAQGDGSIGAETGPVKPKSPYAAFKAVMGGRQGAVLVPTTVLAQQHYNFLADRMAPTPFSGRLSRFKNLHRQGRHSTTGYRIDRHRHGAQADQRCRLQKSWPGHHR